MSDLRPYQKDGVRFLQENSHAFLADEMGLGKSAQLVQASEGPTLVVAPGMVVDSGTWDTQVELWSDDPTRFTQATYSNLTKRAKTAKGGTTPTAHLLEHLDRRWGTVILDEAHYVKTASATRTKAVRQLCKQADRVFLATGTPIPNWPQELFVPLQLVRPEDARPGQDLGSKWRWTERWFRTTQNRYNVHQRDVLGLLGCTPACDQRKPTDPCDHYYEFVRENFQGRFLQRFRDDVLTDLPPLSFEVVKCPMTKVQSREYNRLVKEFCAYVEDQEVLTWSSGAKNTALDKCTTSLGLLGENTDPLKESGKLDQLREDLQSRQRPTLVVAHYQASVEACAEVARTTGASAEVIHGGTSPALRKQYVQRFQAGELDVLCGSLETVAEGLTLTAADLLIQVEKSYKPSRNQQVERRIHRLGQTRPCTVRDYLATRADGGECLDSAKRVLLQLKTDSQTRTLTAAQFKELL